MKSYIDFLTRYRSSRTISVSQVICVILILAVVGCKSTTGSDEPDQNDPPIEDPIPDTEPPSVSIVSPNQDEEISDEYVIQVTATDNDEVESVSIYLDGELLGTVNSTPYEWQVSTTEFFNGTYTLSAKATDKAGNETASDTLSFNIVNYLFVLHLKDSWFDYEGIIQANNPDGSLIAQQEFSRSGTFYLHPPERADDAAINSQSFDEIDLTIISSSIGSESNGQVVSLETHLGLQAWNEWTLEDDEVNNSNDIGFISLNYLNKADYSDHEGFVVSSYPWIAFDDSLNISEFTQMLIGKQPASLFLATDIANTPKYLKIDEIFDGDSVAIDLGNAQDMSQKTVSVPLIPSPNYIDYRVYGRTQEPETESWLTYADKIEMPVSSFESYYPSDVFPEYETRFLSTYEGEDGFHHYYSMGIADQIRKLSSDIIFENTSPDNFQITVTGDDFDELAVYSFSNSANMNTSFTWRIFGPSSRTSFSFPALGDWFKDKYPTFSRTELTIASVDLYKYPELINGYPEYRQLRFENGGLDLDEVVSSYINYWENYSSSSKTKRLTDLHLEKFKDPRFYHPNIFDASRSLVNDQ